MYHSIDEPAEASSSFKKGVVAPQTFDRHMEFLKSEGYTFLSTSDLVDCLNQDGNTLPSKPVVITFDDGFEDFHREALPVIERHDVRATLYITTGYIGGTSEWLASEGEGNRPMLNWSQIADIHNAGVECGAHSHTHPLLDNLTAIQAREEIGVSKQLLEDKLGIPVRSFAYPGGCYSKSNRQTIIDLGYDSACAVKRAMSSTGADRFAMPRIPVHDITTTVLNDLLHGKGKDLLWPPYEQLRRAGFRLVRKSRQILGNND